jgi:hypothetical protein
MTVALAIILISAVYVALQRNIATNRKIRAAEAVDAFLGIDDAPEEYKHIVLGAYEDCTNPTLAFEMARYFLFNGRAQNAQTLDSLKAMEKQHPEYFEEMGKLLVRLVRINVKMAPISYAIVTCVLAIATLSRFATREMKPSALMQRAQEAYFKSVHP